MMFFKSNSASENDTTRSSLTPEDKPPGTQNLRRVALYTYRNLFLLKDKTNTIKKQLWIDRHTFRPTEMRDQEDIPRNFTTMKEYSAILGIVTILDCPFLLLVEDVLPVCTLPGDHIIYTMSSLTFIPFESEDLMQAERKKSLFSYVMYLRKLLCQGYYFSLTYDLTLAHAKRAQNKTQTEIGFQWNYELYREFVKFNIDPAWQIILIQGYIGNFSANIASNQLDYYLISRRSCLNAGTRYHARGIDDGANVANFVESEQLFFFKGKCCSHLQVRGSAPVFWTQRGVQAAIKLERTFALTNHIFLKHMSDLNKIYGHVICVNLMSRSKKEEQMISEAFETHIKANVLSEVGYEFFDFHNAVKNQNYEKTNVLIAKLQPALESLGATVENQEDGVVEAIQQGIMRTNCLDCLDRTNFIQSKLAMAAFDVALNKLGVNLRSIFGQEPFEELDNDNLEAQNALIVGFKRVWADNGDSISLHYTGTGSVISQVTRVGKKGFFGIFDHYAKSLNRFYNGSFEDSLKQDCLDFLLGKNSTAIFNSVNESYESEIRSREKEFSSYSKVSVYIVTWNLGGYALNQSLDLKALFDFRGNPAPDFVVVGFQEYIELNASAVLSSTGKANILQWIELIIKTLKEHDTYILVSARDLVGLLLMVFVKEKSSKNLMQVDTDKVKTGIAGKIGNKGAVICKLHVYDTSLCFVNCHLDPHAKNLDDRLANLVDIHQKAFQEEGLGKRKRELIQNLDTTFLFGDLNFRINMGSELRTLIKNTEFLKSMNQTEKFEQEIKGLLTFDQLKMVQGNDPILSGYSEGTIKFLPTYKYDVGTDQYDSSKKQRNPAWTDRILWNTDGQGIEQMFYDRIEYKISDHRPVVSYITAQVKQIDKEKKNKIIKEVYDIKEVIIKAEPNKLEVEEIKTNGVETIDKITQVIIPEIEDPLGQNREVLNPQTEIAEIKQEPISVSPTIKTNLAVSSQADQSTVVNREIEKKE